MVWSGRSQPLCSRPGSRRELQGRRAGSSRTLWPGRRIRGAQGRAMVGARGNGGGCAQRVSQAAGTGLPSQAAWGWLAKPTRRDLRAGLQYPSPHAGLAPPRQEGCLVTVPSAQEDDGDGTHPSPGTALPGGATGKGSTVKSEAAGRPSPCPSRLPRCRRPNSALGTDALPVQTSRVHQPLPGGAEVSPGCRGLWPRCVGVEAGRGGPGVLATRGRSEGARPALQGPGASSSAGAPGRPGQTEAGRGRSL